jgi:hypothetical protein
LGGANWILTGVSDDRIVEIAEELKRLGVLNKVSPKTYGLSSEFIGKAAKRFREMKIDPALQRDVKEKFLETKEKELGLPVAACLAALTIDYGISEKTKEWAEAQGDYLSFFYEILKKAWDDYKTGKSKDFAAFL